MRIEDIIKNYYFSLENIEVYFVYDLTRLKLQKKIRKCFKANSMSKIKLNDIRMSSNSNEMRDLGIYRA